MSKYQPVTREELKKFVKDNELVQMETSYIGEPPVTLFMNKLGERPAKVVHYEDYGEPTMYYIRKEQDDERQV